MRRGGRNSGRGERQGKGGSLDRPFLARVPGRANLNIRSPPSLLPRTPRPHARVTPSAALRLGDSRARPRPGTSGRGAAGHGGGSRGSTQRGDASVGTRLKNCRGDCVN